MLTLPRNLIGYTHKKSDEEKEKGLKSEYSGDFGLVDERIGLVPESVKPYLLSSQLVILIYYIVILVVFLRHISRRPQI